MKLKKYVIDFCYKQKLKFETRYKKLDKIDNDFWVYVRNSDLESDN